MWCTTARRIRFLLDFPSNFVRFSPQGCEQKRVLLIGRSHLNFSVGTIFPVVEESLHLSFGSVAAVALCDASIGIRLLLMSIVS